MKNYDEERKQIWKIFENIKSETEEFLGRTYPDAPDPNVHIENIQKLVEEYWDIVDCTCDDINIDSPNTKCPYCQSKDI